MTDNDRKNISGEGDGERHHLDQSVYRVRKRINQELAQDIEILQEHRPDILDELREVVCED